VFAWRHLVVRLSLLELLYISHDLPCSAKFCLSNIGQTKTSTVPYYGRVFCVLNSGRAQETRNRHYVTMSLGYDVFRKLDDGHPLWIAEFSSIEEAKANLQLLASKARAEYFIRDASTGAVVFNFVPND
jgi:hypothetical protein